MGEQWMLLWVIAIIGLLIIACVIYDYLDRKKRGQEIQIWKHTLAILIGLILMYPVLGGLAHTLPKFFQRR
jgi:quinol-cytochrome oxidoreductase complex cytochrome b subunit